MERLVLADFLYAQQDHLLNAINDIRKKLGEIDDTSHIQTVRGSGYIFLSQTTADVI
ncbi:helix-turn-helix domain-containing protein [Psychrobium sp. nBUS_13]|uniref:helix-turn-helix domain-containing protein n=1 Tax=Psychrobium sp. nBUS_13 TaxID=3395319 RepID=UPI003EBED949